MRDIILDVQVTLVVRAAIYIYGDTETHCMFVSTPPQPSSSFNGVVILFWFSLSRIPGEPTFFKNTTNASSVYECSDLQPSMTAGLSLADGFFVRQLVVDSVPTSDIVDSTNL